MCGLRCQSPSTSIGGDFPGIESLQFNDAQTQGKEAATEKGGGKEEWKGCVYDSQVSNLDGSLPVYEYTPPTPQSVQQYPRPPRGSIYPVAENHDTVSSEMHGGSPRPVPYRSYTQEEPFVGGGRCGIEATRESGRG